MAQQITPTRAKQTGQSLVEVALFLPILVILIAGVVEISQLVITQNRISNAARAAARFGANGGEDDGMWLVALNSVTQTLDLDENNWDMWAIRGTINDTGDGFNNDWSFEHVYGISNTVLYSSVNESTIQQEVLNELSINEEGTSTDAAGLRIVAAYILHDVDSIIGLDAFPALAEVSSARALNVMRVTGVEQNPTRGCAAFPIAVSDIVRSVTPPGDTGPYPYPDAKDFRYPDPPPEYEDFPNHVPNEPLSDAKEGYIYIIKSENPTPGNFSWLHWNTTTNYSAESLEHSLVWPGDSINYPNYGYYEPDDRTDNSLNIGDFVEGSTGVVSSVKDEMEVHVDRERQLRLIVWDITEDIVEDNGGTKYRIVGFALFRIVGFRLDAPWLVAEFIRWDDSCGQVIQ